MSLKTLIVFIDATPTCNVRMHYAMRLASQHDAHIIGIHTVQAAWRNNDVYSYITGASAVREMTERHTALEDGASIVVRNNFETIARAEAVMHEFREIREEDAGELARLHSLHADLVIVGHPAPGGLPPLTSPDGMLIATGVPFLIVPNISHGNQVARTILLAWNASKEARRAITDALPLLKAVDSVAVVIVDAHENALHGEEPGADVALHLSRHGVRVRVEQRQSNGLSVADVIRNIAMEKSYDLIVLGAYSHAKSMELIFGGVTRSLLRDLALPTLIAH